MDRIVKILDILSSDKTVKTSLLAEMLDVSHVTLRRDLDALERRGIVKRTHGCVSLDGANDTGKRMAVNHSIKKRIAKAAARIIDDGETVLIESGSCCALFAEELAMTKKNITIVTNSVFISNYVNKRQNIKIILLGGYLQPEYDVLVGPMTEKCAESVFSDKFFIGADGFVPHFGFTGRDHLRAETAGKMAKRAKKAFILTESAKFQRHGAYNLLNFNKIAGVFTDDGIPKEAEAALIKEGIYPVKVPFPKKRSIGGIFRASRPLYL